jgi:tetratricopeptide (TPR) repeat protein
LDKVTEAIEDYSEALKHLSSSDSDYRYQTFFNRGICRRRVGDLVKSIEDFKEAIKLKSDRSSAHNNLALSYFENSDFEEALTHYGKAIGYEPSSIHYNNRGLAFYNLDRLEEAKQDFDIALEKDPNDPSIYLNRGNVYLNWKPDPRFELAH